MEQNHSWLKASIIAFLLHVLAALLLVLWLTQVAEEKDRQTYIIDLAESNFSQGSGHAGGGGGGGSASGAAGFPEPLQEEEMAKRVETVQQAQTAAAEAAAVATSEPVRMPPPAKSESQSQSQSTSHEIDSKRERAVGSDVGSSTGKEQGSGGTGTDSGSGSGTGSGEGSGTGGGLGSGSGAGTGDGSGTSDGSGDGQGSGDGNVSGTGSAPFDFVGFRAAINANKEYPTMAIKREMQGSVTIHCVLDTGGNVVSVSLLGSSGHDILDEAAVSAAQEVGSYPNPTGAEVRVNVTVDFYIR